MTSKAWLTAVILCGVVVSTAGCTQQDEPISQIRSFLATEHSPDDVLPSSFPAVDGLDAESSREVGVIGNLRYFVATYGESGACLIIVDSASKASASACGYDVNGLRMTNSEVGGAKVLQGDDEIPTGWVKLSDLLIVNPDATQ